MSRRTDNPKPSDAPTELATAERADPTVLQRQARLLAEEPMLRALYDAVTEYVLVLNRQRQIVFCNRGLTALLGVDDRAELYGARPGEALGCVHALEDPDGCGTTEFCSTCGAANAILTTLGGAPGLQECRITRSDNDVLDLLVRTSHLDLNGETFTICAMTDISHRKRREALERVFFHDLLNLTMALQMLTQNLLDGDSNTNAEALNQLDQVAQQLHREVRAQHNLAAAENRDLQVRIRPLRSLSIVHQVAASFEQFAQRHQCTLVVAEETEDVPFRSDPDILSRVLANVVRNAVEASQPGECATIGCASKREIIQFWVHNRAYMPREVQLQLFHRSFSTKGEGRGLGAYSMKLLTERYLGGDVAFETSREEGTVFTVSLPRLGPA